jgi:hypothetical protein
MRRTVTTCVFAALLCWSLTGCSDSGDDGGEDSDLVTTETMTVTDNVTATVTAQDIAGLTRGDALRLRLNRADTTVIEVAATYLSTVEPDGVYACESSVPVGEGDSGSPVILEVSGELRVLGALAFAFENDAHFFSRTPWLATCMIPTTHPLCGS